MNEKKEPPESWKDDIEVFITRLVRLYSAYKLNKSPVMGRQIEEMTGIPYDEKDYGADQNVAKGAEDGF